MDLLQVLLAQAGRLTSLNAGTDQRPQARDRLSRAPFATQSATHFDLGRAAAEAHGRRRCGHFADTLTQMAGSMPGRLRLAVAAPIVGLVLWRF
jgi:hypothetical protein